MIKLFYCAECDRHYSEASAKVSFRSIVKIDDEGKFWITSECDPYEETVEAKDFTCIGYSEHVVSLVSLYKCPHEWREVPNAWKPHRRCVLCGADQEGRAVFDD